MKKQVVVIHGGDTFDTYDDYFAFLKNFAIESLDYFLKKGWKSGLPLALGAGYEVIAPQMPSRYNAKYSEWKVWFEKVVPFINDGVILVGHSLGGIFIAKYLSENKLPVKISAVLLISAPYDAGADESLADFILPASLKQLAEQGGEIFLYHSKDDMVVPFANVEKYKQALPNANLRVFEDRGHFNQETFPELVEIIKSL